MNTDDLESLTLLLVRDSGEPKMWTERWLCSYPMVQVAECRADAGIDDWQRTLQAAFSQIGSGRVMLVAHGAGAVAVAAWYYATPVGVQRRLVGAILVSPPAALCRTRDDAAHTLQRVRFNCKTALVIGENDPQCPADWAAEQAAVWRARLLVSPHSGHLNGMLGGWQWGMKLMQEMLLA